MHEARVRDRARLVALHPPDEMPLDAGDVREGRPLRRPLLHVVFAERRQTGADRLSYDGRVLAFGHADQPNLGTGAAGACARDRDALLDGRDAFPQSTRHRRSHAATSGSGRPITLVYEPSTRSMRWAPSPWIAYEPARSNGSPVAR